MHKIVPGTTSPPWKHQSNWAFFEFARALGSVKSSFSVEGDHAPGIPVNRVRWVLLDALGRCLHIWGCL